MKLSIITICYNSEKTLEKTILSVLRQKTSYVEYIIVDGKSTDHTLDIINKYREGIDVVISEKDTGISDAFNKGINIAKGEWIGIINSDDQYFPDAFKLFFRNVREESDVFYGHGVRVYADGKYKKYCSKKMVELLHETMPIVHPSTFVKKIAYQKYGLFDVNYKSIMDRELLLRMINAGARFQFYNAYFSFYNMGGMSDKNYFKYVLKESYILDRKDGMSMHRAILLYMKDATLYILVKIRNRMGFNKCYRNLEEALKNSD